MSDQSEAINELAKALAVAQGTITGALKDSDNPFFKSKYADLASCWDACRAALAANGLAVIQTTTVADGEVVLVTTLAHSSGQWIRGWLPVRAKDQTAQSQGSGLTYARRYALAAIVGIAQIDDDGNAAQGKINPMDHGEKVTAKQAADAQSFARDFRMALNNDVEVGVKAKIILALSDEASEDGIVKMEAWKLLDSKERAAIKAYIKLAGA